MPRSRKDAAIPANRSSTRRVVIFLITLAVAGGAVGGIKWLGDSARREIAQRERYSVLFGDIRCDAPPGYDRAAFLSEVSYHSKFPARFQSIEPDLAPRLSAAFAAHPWVAAVEDVSVEPENVIRVKLRFRVPALAVRISGTGDEVRIVDNQGVLLPLKTDRGSLPTLLTPVFAPSTPSGAPWADETVKRAVELVDAHHPRALERSAKGWLLTMHDGKVLAVER
jgi:hypothetical protein